MHTNENDIPAPRTIRVGTASIGLIGLDPALNKAIADQLPDEEATEFLFREISEKNYIPASAEESYRKALLAEYQRRLGKKTADSGALTIRVLGSGCVTCNQLSAMLIQALQKFNLAADMESVHELDEIWRFGVTKTPALIINGKTKCAGRMPTLAEVEEWVREETQA